MLKLVNPLNVMFASLVIFVVPALCTASPHTPVTVKGLRIVSDGYGTDIDGLKPFNSFKGTSVACLVTLPQGGIIKFDRDSSSLDTFVDNLGNNLMNDEVPIGSGIGMMSDVSSDKKAVMFELTGLNLPNEKATSVMGSGHVSIITATEKKSHKINNLSLKVGVGFSLPGLKVEITKIGKPFWGDDAVSITFSSGTDLSGIESIQFYDKNGKSLKASNGGTATQTMGTKKTYERAYNLQVQPEAVNLTVVCWDDMQTIKVPFQIKTSVGL